MPKFEAKKGDFANIWQKLGGAAAGGGSTVHGLLCMVSEGLSLSQQTFQLRYFISTFKSRINVIWI